MTKHFFNILSAIVLVLAFSACQDDTFSSFEQQEGIKEGETVVSATISFKPLAEGLTSRTAGDAIKAITDLNILAYDESDNLVKVQRYTSGTNSTTTYTLSNADRTDADAENNKTAESKTPRAELKLALPYGKYKIYAVANMDDIANTHADAIKTINGLKAISLTWNADNVAANCQMFGYFTGSGSETESEPTVTINRDDISLHAWIRRAASKVTVAYDGSALNDNIYIYIHSAQIKDIPAQCYLANENTVGAEGYTLSNTLIADGETIDYTEGSTENAAGITITKGNPKGGSEHKETEDALFFYENMQGTGPNKHNYKNFESKDNKPYGSYIEVKGYYVNRTEDNSSQGPIIYRFMLGKNVSDDFNAERNYHYKLTLKFKNNANDPDWHIVYEPESPEITIPDPLYISYVPNESVNVPVVVRGATSSTQVKADIIESHWYGDKGHKYQGLYYQAFNGILTLKPTGGDLAKEAERQADFNAKNGLSYSPSQVLADRCLYSIPVYTRGLTLGNSFSGYNYFPHDTRTGKIRFTVTVNGKEYTKDVRIIQVKRVVNPAGVWREASSTQQFNFRLMELNEDDDSNTGAVHRQFYPTISDGPWTAHIEQGSDWVQISPTGSGNWGTSDVTGGTASEVRFDVRPASTCGDGTVRHGVIKVTYNNNTCIHYFFVSQGIGEVPMSVNITYPLTTVYGETSTSHTCYWMNRNMKYAGVPCDNPLMEGGKFRWGNSAQSFKPEDDYQAGYGFNNVCSSLNGHLLYPSGTNSFANISQTEMPIGFRNNENSYTSRFYDNLWPAKYADWTALQSLPRYYGVLYGEESAGTATNTTDAYTYINPGNVKGMQGLFVWDRTNARHLFFPIGATGYGHRKGSDLYRTDWGGDGNVKRDVLKYAQRSLEMPTATAQGIPMLYDLWMRKGAIYWYEENEFYTTGEERFAHDINYYTYDLNTYGANPVTMIQSNSTYNGHACRNAQWVDACYVRCVHY